MNTKKPKPRIDDVCNAFHQFHIDVSEAMRENRAMSEEQSRAFNAARDKLRVAMRELGLERAIDWSNTF